MKDLAKLAERLDEARDYFDQRADADADFHGYRGNEEMKLLRDLDYVRAELKRLGRENEAD